MPCHTKPVEYLTGLLADGDKACNKKLQPQGSDYYCEKCGTLVENVEWRYIMSFQVTDVTGESLYYDDRKIHLDILCR